MFSVHSSTALKTAKSGQKVTARGSASENRHSSRHSSRVSCRAAESQMHVLAWGCWGGAGCWSASMPRQMQSAWRNRTPAQSVIYHYVIIPHTAFGYWLVEPSFFPSRDFPAGVISCGGSDRFASPLTPSPISGKPTFGFTTSCWVRQPPS